ncbi:C2H2 type zinc finger domain [Fusarium acutatum]|uniref:C2H2 type zinc finger domain n=1 Tax=Fusarium acutatum TaxID=78861 RepID=A0A8H4K3E8_9HYPO|nr:C2H2 type zinc finger domain [Fusarium acutatum]
MPNSQGGLESLNQEQPVDANADVELLPSAQQHTEKLYADTVITFKPIGPSFDPIPLPPEWNPEAWLTSSTVVQDKDHGLLQDLAFVNMPCPFRDVGAFECSVENETSWDHPLIPNPCPTDPIHRTDLPQFPEHAENGVREEVSTACESGASDETSINCPSALEPQLAWTAENDICDAEDFGHVPQISTDIYNIIRTKFDDLNGDSSTSQPFTQTEFPSSAVLNAFIQSYFEYFHPGFPILHNPSFDPSSKESNWLLVLAVATIGCRFSLALSPQILFLLQESLRRSIVRILHVDYDSCVVHNLPLAQAAILSQVGMMFSRHQRFTDYAESTACLIATMCRKANSHADFEPRHGGDTSSLENEITGNSSLNKSWKAWVVEESTRRMVYGCLLLDFQFSALFDLPALIDIDSIHLPMPCSENLWNADTEEMWHRNMTQVPRLGRFGALILTFGIYRDQIDSEAKYNYLSMVRPDEAHIQSNESLDQLVFQHNHTLSFCTKLPPRQLFAFSGWRTTVAQQKEAENHIRDWLSEDMARSRLCLVHAAKVYSSIRSTRTYGHHEVMAILLSTLAIWSISSIHRVVRSSSSAELLPSYHAAWARGSVEGLAKKRTIRLDKILDGSTLAAWISGQVDFRPYLAGIGTLDDQGTARRLIRDSLQQLMYSVAWCLGEAVAEVLNTHYRTKTGDLGITQL